MGDTRPRILIVSLEKWQAISRLPKALQQSGFEVAALCYPNSYLATTRHLDQLFFLHSMRLGSRVFRGIAATINQWNPQLVVPGDDRAVLFFHRIIQLHQEAKQTLPPRMLETLRLSFGNFSWLAEATSKHLTLQRAQKLGLKTPRFAHAHTVNEAVSLAKDLGWPVAVKKSTGWAGQGVAFCDNEQQVALVFQKYNRVSGMIKSRLIQLRGWSLGPEWFPADCSVTVNEVIRGKSAMFGVAAANGKILAHAAAMKEQTYPHKNGPSSVVRFIQHPRMEQTIEKLVGQWGATGLLGFDFILSADGEASLLECNARPISITPMGNLTGHDLCLALHHHLTGLEIPAPTAPRHQVVAHFPNEWRRDPASPYLHDAYHDVPWDDPVLLQRLMEG